MICKEIMKRDVASVSEQESVLDAVCRMRDRKVDLLPVHDREQQVVGVLTDQDIVRCVCAGAGLSRATLIRDVMSRDIVACRAEDDIRISERLMSLHHQLWVLITDGQGHLSGVISLAEIAEAEEPQRTIEMLRAVLNREAGQERRETREETQALPPAADEDTGPPAPANTTQVAT